MLPLAELLGSCSVGERRPRGHSGGPVPPRTQQRSAGSVREPEKKSKTKGRVGSGHRAVRPGRGASPAVAGPLALPPRGHPALSAEWYPFFNKLLLILKKKKRVLPPQGFWAPQPGSSSTLRRRGRGGGVAPRVGRGAPCAGVRPARRGPCRHGWCLRIFPDDKKSVIEMRDE